MSEYIEREKAQKIICGWCGICENPTLNDLMHCDDICPQFAQIPAVDVRPVVRGRWIGNKRHQSCSECHMTYCVPDGQDGELDMTAYHFCPNCGARMEES